MFKQSLRIPGSLHLGKPPFLHMVSAWRDEKLRGRQDTAVQGVLWPCLEVLCIDSIPSFFNQSDGPT